jgi:hypothetical protein
VSLGDIDGDSATDVASVGFTEDGSVLILNLSSTAASPEQFLIPGTDATVGAIDVDHDGDLDLIVVSSDGQATVFVNDGRAGFQRRTVPAGAHVADSLTSTPFCVCALTGTTGVVATSPSSASCNLRTARVADRLATPDCALPRAVTSRGPPPASRV